MNVLYVDHYAGSTRHGMEFRPFYMAREWQKLGHTVHIVAASQSHLRRINPAVTHAWTEERVDGVDFVWLKTSEYQGNGAGRVRNMLQFVKALYVHSATLIRRFAPDVVIASSTYPFDVFPARRIARAASAKLIFELHDLWPLSPMELGGMSRWHPFILATQFAEDYVCRHADFVISMLPKAEEHLRSRGLAPGKFRYVPNGVVLEEWNVESVENLPREHATELARLRSAGAFTLIYAGAHGLLNNLSLFLQAAALLREENVGFVFVGQGPEKPRLERFAHEQGLRNVLFLPPVQKNAVPVLLDAADALLLGFAPQPLFRFGVSPNKLMDYMMAGKPIVAAMRAGNNPVEEHQCGFTVPPDDPFSVVTAIRKLMSCTSEEKLRMGANAQEAVRRVYDYKVLAQCFSSCFEN